MHMTLLCVCDLPSRAIMAVLGSSLRASFTSSVLAVACSARRSCVPLIVASAAGPSRNAFSWETAAQKHGVEFVGSYSRPIDMPVFPGLPEFTLAGRSNVGKSSALNTLVGGRKKLAVVSKTPGRTRSINLFKVGKVCTITDLPGYGFAKVSQDMQDDWKRQITTYLRKREALQLAVLFVDAQRDPQELDAQLLDFLEDEGRLASLVVATKTDKLAKTKLEASLARLHESLALPDGEPLPLSSKTGAGKKELWQRITAMCSGQ